MSVSNYLLIENMSKEITSKEEILGNEKGFGLVESLIAIVLAGVASVALISVAIGVIREANNNQIRDAMNYYAVQGLEEVRVMAAEDSNFDDGVGGLECPTGGGSVYGMFEGGELIKIENGIFKICSEIGSDTGTCERLEMPGNEKDFLYREVALKMIDGECYKQRVEVTVGMLANDPGTDHGPRGFISEVTIVGYIAEH